MNNTFFIVISFLIISLDCYFGYKDTNIPRDNKEMPATFYFFMHLSSHSFRA